jgi:hypothetical protein
MNKTKLSILSFSIILNVLLGSALGITLYTLTKESSWKVVSPYGFIVETEQVYPCKISTKSWVVMGFSHPNETSTIQVTFQDLTSSGSKANYKIYIVNDIIIHEDETPFMDPHSTWTTPIYTFMSPSVYNIYTIKIVTTKV